MMVKKMNEYKYLIVPITTIIICQTLKFTIESIRNKKLVWSRLYNGTGGMPSSHTSFTSSLTIFMGIEQGFNSPLFAISLIFTIIVAYDAMGLRMESGKQAVAINKIFKKIKTDKEEYKDLKEQLGHKPLEVLAGLILGITSAIIFSNIL